MVSDPVFTGLPPAQQREALSKLTKDSTFTSLSDADTASFISRMSPRATTPSAPTATVSAAPPPGLWERMKGAVPVLGRAEYGLQTGFARPGNVSTAQALAKPPDAMSEERALAPEKLLTPAQQQAHPIATGAAEFAGGMSTPENMLLMGTSGLLGQVPGAAGRVLPSVASGIFSAQTLRGAYNEVPDFRAAVERQDWSGAERIGTHILLGAVMAGLGIKHAATGESIPATEGPVKSSLYEGYRRTGQYFDNLRHKNVTLNSISEAATGLYHKIQQDLITHQEVLRNDGTRTIQDAIDADKAALMNTNRGSIPTGKVVGEAAKLLASTDYEMKPAERVLYNRIVNQPEMTLEQAKNMRTAIGRMAFGRSSLAPEAKAVFTSAYEELGQGMKDRIQELHGSTRPFEHYNNQFEASFELYKGIAGEMLESLQGKDRHAAMPKMEKFSDANLTELQDQMRKMGLDQQARSLDKSQEHARSLVGAYDVANGAYMSGIYRLLMRNPRQAWPGLLVMMAGHGMKMPFPGPQIAGAIVASGHIGTKARGRAAAISQELKATLAPEYFRTRTEAEAPETFRYKDPDEGWGGGKPSVPNDPQAAKAAAVKEAMARKRGSGGARP